MRVLATHKGYGDRWHIGDWRAEKLPTPEQVTKQIYSGIALDNILSVESVSPKTRAGYILVTLRSR
jgi:hypothetical protein